METTSPFLGLGLNIVVPGAQYMGSLTAGDQAAYDALDWRDARPKPPFSKVMEASLIAAKTVLKQFAATQRLLRQRDGFTHRGHQFHIDDMGSWSNLTAAALMANINKNHVARWKTMNGSFVPMDATAIINLFSAASRYIENLYNAEHALHAAIDNGSVTTQQQIVAAIKAVSNVS